jgi:hypothetical protein
MKTVIILFILCIHALKIIAQSTDCYVAYSTGINMRKTPSLKAELIGKIPYSTLLKIEDKKIDTVPVIVEGMTGYWVEVNYQNKKGYVLNCYLIHVVPPKKGTKKMSDYLLQLSPKFGSSLVYKKGNVNIMTEDGYEVKKQLYKNANEWHQYLAYESNSDSYFVNGLSNLQEAFLILRQIEEFQLLFSEKDEFPNKSKNYTKKSDISNTIDFVVVVEKSNDYSGGYIKKIIVQYQEGASYEFEMFMLDGAIVISYGGGV